MLDKAIETRGDCELANAVRGLGREGFDGRIVDPGRSTVAPNLS
jgi:hypothetical protein